MNEDKDYIEFSVYVKMSNKAKNLVEFIDIDVDGRQNKLDSIEYAINLLNDLKTQILNNS